MTVHFYKLLSWQFIRHVFRTPCRRQHAIFRMGIAARWRLWLWKYSHNMNSRCKKPRFRESSFCLVGFLRLKTQLEAAIVIRIGYVRNSKLPLFLKKSFVAFIIIACLIFWSMPFFCTIQTKSLFGRALLRLRLQFL